MKTPKLIRKAKEYLNASKSKQRKKKKYIRELLKKLKKKERSLKEKSKKEKDAKKRRQINQDLKIIFAQRKKGVTILKGLKKS
jgi:DNA polymerase II small subunit/DNA polymerase delta subunit B